MKPGKTIYFGGRKFNPGQQLPEEIAKLLGGKNKPIGSVKKEKETEEKPSK